MSSQKDSAGNTPLAMVRKEEHDSIDDGSVVVRISKYAEWQITNKLVTNDKACDKDINVATKQDQSKKSCPFLEKAPPEVLLKIYDGIFEDIKIDADSGSLDVAVTRPAILEVHKLIRREAMGPYLNGIFSAMLDTRKEYVALKHHSKKATEATRGVRDSQLHGQLMLIAMPLVVRAGSQMVCIGQYANWLKAKVTSLDSAHLVSEPHEKVQAAFKRIAEDARSPFGPAPQVELMELLLQLEKQQRQRSAG
ncbi:uncharacterized protein CLAFUR5_09919 [Fulvia fulva]|uniref:Uncharacterized protein n=1 Tax=Passalora fulva TaxID=5499 RepID=A0A9Q8PBW0_PASFU|nr:uncharacterized protein CLAFUR5_09919 [Fulvia fulva]UJO19562.1 hypothetical protein CLAFUR5_09919 [Fulvia fulva]